MTMPWGKYRGQRVGSLPSAYLVWVLENCDDVPWELSDAIRRELSLRFGLRAESRPASDRRQVRDAVGNWYRRLAFKYHPDRGGTDEQMKVVNAARDELEAALQLTGG
ncbi:MAG: DUF3820 family protein [Gemmataceae bacterium]